MLTSLMNGPTSRRACVGDRGRATSYRRKVAVAMQLNSAVDSAKSAHEAPTPIVGTSNDLPSQDGQRRQAARVRATAAANTRGVHGAEASGSHSLEASRR